MSRATHNFVLTKQGRKLLWNLKELRELIQSDEATTEQLEGYYSLLEIASKIFKPLVQKLAKAGLLFITVDGDDIGLPGKEIQIQASGTIHDEELIALYCDFIPLLLDTEDNSQSLDLTPSNN